MLKFIFTIFYFFILFAQGYTQDQIVTAGGAVMDCKVLSVDSANITFIHKIDEREINSSGKIETVRSIKLGRKKFVVSELSNAELNNLMQIAKEKPIYVGPDQDMSLKLDIILPSISIEAKAGNNNSILFSFQPGFVWQKVNDEPTESYIVPQYRVAFRSFYNFDRRKEQGKITNKFSGDFLSLSVMYTSETKVTYNYYTIAATAGMQRAWGNIIHFSIEIGPGFAFSDKPISKTVSLFGDLKLGLAL